MEKSLNFSSLQGYCFGFLSVVLCLHSCLETSDFEISIKWFMFIGTRRQRCYQILSATLCNDQAVGHMEHISMVENTLSDK